ncbi:MAG: hypothetical protein J7K83_00580 [Candidatus Aenigmarchaeota archaeon]|nr:hypothetical protein [Candidatus Aenigmarchaeota archaeon]
MNEIDLYTLKAVALVIEETEPDKEKSNVWDIIEKIRGFGIKITPSELSKSIYRLRFNRILKRENIIYDKNNHEIVKYYFYPNLNKGETIKYLEELGMNVEKFGESLNNYMKKLKD